MQEFRNNPFISIEVLLSVLLGGGSLITSSDKLNKADVAAAEARLKTIELKIEGVISDHETMSKHWKLHTWAKDEINELRLKQGLEPSRWPDL